MRRVDVAIIGLGPAGASAAIEAAKAGLCVVGVDRKKTPGEPVQCAEFVPKLIASQAPIAAVTVQDIAAMHTYIEAAPRHEKPDFPGAMISRAAFDAGLAEAARAAGAELSFGRRVTDVTQHGVIAFADADPIKAALIIAADGPRSIVGARCGRTNCEIVETRQITTSLASAHAATDIFLSADIPGGYGWLFPKADHANIGAGIDARYRARLKHIVSELHARLVEAGRVGGDIVYTTGGAIPVGGPLDPLARVGATPILLAGDAAGLANPITGAGIASAVISGRLAGAAAARFARGDGAALAAFRDELADLFHDALARAYNRRTALLQRHLRGERPLAAHQRRAWIAYPDYWPEYLTEPARLEMAP
jgi:geranylgeranyl reductase family protein